MNTATRVLSETRVSRPYIHTTYFKPNIGTLLLALLVMLSGLAVVYVADVNRRLAMELQQEQTYQHQLKLETSKLLLEYTTLSTEQTVENRALGNLHMEVPKSDQVTMVKLM